MTHPDKRFHGFSAQYFPSFSARRVDVISREFTIKAIQTKGGGLQKLAVFPFGTCRLMPALSPLLGWALGHHDDRKH
jgi:hypothetical protein